nr:MAG TPA: hypothetical protein [Caudoviricetes sp.]
MIFPATFTSSASFNFELRSYKYIIRFEFRNVNRIFSNFEVFYLLNRNFLIE